MDIKSNIDTQAANSAILQSKLDKLEQFKAASNDLPIDEKKRKEIEKAARGFESMFVNMMFKGMKEAMLDKGNMLGGDEEDSSNGYKMDSLMEYTDMMMSDNISKTGNGIGIASRIYEQLTGGEKLNNITSEFIAEKITNLYRGDK